MTTKNINISKKITYLLFLILFLIGIFTFKDYGISIDEEFQRRLPQLIMRAKCKLKHGVTAAETPKKCNPIELDFQSDIEENEAVLQVLNTAGEVDTTHFSNQPGNLSAGLVELLMKELQD